MARLNNLLAFVALAASCSAANIPRDTASACANPGVVANQTLSAGGIDIQLTTFACNTAQPESNFILPFPILPFPFPFGPPPPPHKPTKTSASATSTSSAPAATPTVDVCNEICTNNCGSLGDLPPISEDCQSIFDSITILSGSITPTFDVAPGNIQQLTFGTCRVFFENFSNETASECWTSLSNVASAAGTLCFPPTQPVNSAGFCSPSDGSWQIGIAHS